MTSYGAGGLLSARRLFTRIFESVFTRLAERRVDFLLGLVALVSSL